MSDRTRPYVEQALALGLTVEAVDRTRRHPHLHLRAADGRRTRIAVASSLGDRTRGFRNLVSRLRRFAENRDSAYRNGR